jgi:hypothetical protein
MSAGIDALSAGNRRALLRAEVTALTIRMPIDWQSWSHLQLLQFIGDVDLVKKGASVSVMIEAARRISTAYKNGEDVISAPRAGAPLRDWWLEFDSEGVPLSWVGVAVSERAAEGLARADLARHPCFNRTTARLTACIERDIGTSETEEEEEAARARMDEANDGGDAAHGFFSAALRWL